MQRLMVATLAALTAGMLAPGHGWAQATSGVGSSPRSNATGTATTNTAPNAATDTAPNSSTTPADTRPLVIGGDFSIEGLDRQLTAADGAIESQNYTEAFTILTELRETSNALSNHYQKLSGQFSGIDNRIYDEHRRHALEAAQRRDSATYRLAIVYDAQGRPELAVPLLLEVLASQSPNRELGRNSYNQLYALGFTTQALPSSDEAATGDNSANSASPVSNASNAVNTVGNTTASNAIVNASDLETPAPKPLSDGLLSLSGVSRLMLDADAAVTNGNYATAIGKLQEARQLSNQLSGFYQQLTSSFSGVNNEIYQTNRDNAINAAQMRDEASYQLALLFRAAEEPDLAVPLLVEVVASQSPTRDLGKQAYRQLYELGFVDALYPRGSV